MSAYEIMRGWDLELGINPRSDAELDLDVPGGLTGDYEEWKARLEGDEVDAILEGRMMWGLAALI